MWIELDTSLLGHPKVSRLSALLKIKHGYSIGLVASLYLWTAIYAEETGDLTKFSPFEIKTGLHWHRDAKQLIEALTTAGFLDKREDRLMVHDWTKHGTRLLRQSRERQRRHREKQTSGSAALNAERAEI